MSPYTSLTDVARYLAESDDILICGHVSPDGDCIGSQLALAGALRSLGKRVTCLLAKADALEYGLAHLPGIEEAVVAKDFHGDFTTFVTVDVPNAKRMGDEASALHARAQRTITIDHHPSETPLSQINYIDADASACALIIWDIIAELGVAPSADIASLCYVGLMTDTGRFQYQNTSPASFLAASEMVKAGANPSALATLMYQNRTRASLQLEECMLSKTCLIADGQVAYSYLLIRDFSDTGALRSDAEPLIDVLRSLHGVRVACLLREQENGIRGSLRAKDDVDVSAIAKSFGGGGHRAAAGFTFEGTMEEALAAIKHTFNDLATTL